VEAAISPRLLLAEHRWPSGAQEGGRADEEQQYDEEGVEVEQRRLPSGRGRPQHHDGRGVVVLVLTMPARAARARQEKRTKFSPPPLLAGRWLLRADQVSRIGGSVQ